jgi:hypothetical protein
MTQAFNIVSKAEGARFRRAARRIRRDAPAVIVMFRAPSHAAFEVGVAGLIVMSARRWGTGPVPRGSLRRACAQLMTVAGYVTPL